MPVPRSTCYTRAAAFTAARLLSAHLTDRYQPCPFNREILMSKAWTFQKADDVKNQGEATAPWYVGWLEPDGRRKSKSCGAGSTGRKTAERLKSKLTSELMTGTYQQKTDILWDDFVTEYAKRVLDGLDPATKDLATRSLEAYARHMKPHKVWVINTGHIDEFISLRRKDRGLKGGELVSPATVNKDLRHVRAALNVAVEWGYLPRIPRFRMEKTVKKIPRYMTPEHFALIYGACDVAKKPAKLPYPPGDWWRGLLVFGYMTGWRIGDLTALRRADLDLKDGYAITRGTDNKGGRDDRVKLHPVIVEHLERIPSLDQRVFPFPHDVTVLRNNFDRIQKAAGIHLSCPGRHEHTPACHLYGFHDIRRAFATINAPRLTADALQTLMRHKSYTTTQIYINMARQMDDAVNVLHVPDVLRKNA